MTNCCRQVPSVLFPMDANRPQITDLGLIDSTWQEQFLVPLLHFHP